MCIRDSLWAEQSDLQDGQMPEDAAQATAQIQQSGRAGQYSNQATMTGLEDGVTYAYQLVNGETKSEIYTFRTGSGSGAFSFAMAGDPQIGAGSTSTDTEGWDKTLRLVAEDPAFDGVEFLLSAGDQDVYKRQQRALIQYRNPKNYDLVEEALRKAGRTDLIGFDQHCLIRPRRAAQKLQTARQRMPQAAKHKPEQETVSYTHLDVYKRQA